MPIGLFFNDIICKDSGSAHFDRVRVSGLYCAKSDDLLFYYLGDSDLGIKLKPSDRWSLFGLISGLIILIIYMKILYLEGHELSLRHIHHWIVICLPVLLIGLFRKIGKQKEAIEYYSDFLGKKIDEKTGQLIRSDLKLKEQLNEKIYLLENIPLGIFYFDKSGYLSKDMSGFLLQSLPGLSQMNHISEFFSFYLNQKPQQTQILMNLLWNEDGIYYHFDTIASKFGKEFTINSDGDVKNFFKLSYIDLKNSDMVLEKIIVMISDETEHHSAFIQKSLQEEKMRQLEIAASNLPVFKAFTDESESLAERIRELFSDKELSLKKELLLGLIHTLKGNWSSYGFLKIASKVYQLENSITKSESLIPDGSEFKLWQQIYQQWMDSVSEIKKIIGLGENSSAISVNKDKYDQMGQALRQSGSETFVNQFNDLKRVSLGALLERNIQFIQNLALNRRKNLEVIVDPTSEGLEPKEYAMLEGFLNHILKNCLDHGIELPEQREKAGKARTGKIEICCKREGKNLTISVQDDGAGIDLIRLKSLAVTLGLWTEEKASEASDEEVVNLVFFSGVSTHGTVDEISGRGLGLNFVKQEIEKRGGHLTITSQVNKGTRMQLILPLQND